MRVFISHSYSHRKNLKHTLAAITETVLKCGGQSFVFTQEYQFDPADYQVMMQKACEEISSSDILIAEISHKAVGIGVEVGYAKGIGKKVICIRSKNSPISTTLMGVADVHIEFNDLEDMKNKLSKIITNIHL